MPILDARQTSTPSAGGIADTVTSVKETFSSWNGCMSKTYCKWPVIAGIIVGSLILLTLLWCFARCLCCGAECACCCFRCCAGCCGSKNKKHKQLDSAPNTPYRTMPPQGWNQQYQSPPRPMYYAPAAAASFATFDASTSKPIHEDSLPAMPSWENAASRKIEVLEKPEEHEMDKIDPSNNYDTSKINRTQPAVTSPTPVRPVAPGSPFSEGSTFFSGSAYSQSPHPGQQGAGNADSQSGYRGAAPSPAQFGGYNSRAYGGGDQYGDQYDRHYNNGTVTPVFASPSDTDVYDSPGGHYNPPGRHHDPPGRQYEPPNTHYEPPVAHYDPPGRHYEGDRYNQQGSLGYSHQAPRPYAQSQTSPYEASQRHPTNSSWRDV